MRVLLSLIIPVLASAILVPASLAQHNCGRCPAAKSCPSSTVKADSSTPDEPVFQKLPGAGKRVWIGKTNYFIYNLDKTPKIGVVVLKVQMFKANGAKDRDFEITGISDMPSLKGAHRTEGQFKLNRLGDYLLPINFTARGEWEIRLVFRKDGNDLYYGCFTLKV